MKFQIEYLVFWGNISVVLSLEPVSGGVLSFQWGVFKVQELGQKSPDNKTCGCVDYVRRTIPQSSNTNW